MYPGTASNALTAYTNDATATAMRAARSLVHFAADMVMDSYADLTAFSQRKRKVGKARRPCVMGAANMDAMKACMKG